MTTQTIDRRLVELEQLAEPGGSKNLHVCYLVGGMTEQRYREEHNLTDKDRLLVVEYVNCRNSPTLIPPPDRQQ